jgi:hypothetical protein
MMSGLMAVRIGRDAWSHVSTFLNAEEMACQMAPVCRLFLAAVEFGGLRTVTEVRIGRGQVGSLAQKVGKLSRLAALTIRGGGETFKPIPPLAGLRLTSLAIQLMPARWVTTFLNELRGVERLTLSWVGAYNGPFPLDEEVVPDAWQTLRHIHLSSIVTSSAGLVAIFRSTPRLISARLDLVSVADEVLTTLGTLRELEVLRVKASDRDDWSPLIESEYPRLRSFSTPQQMEGPLLRTFLEQHPQMSDLDLKKLHPSISYEDCLAMIVPLSTLRSLHFPYRIVPGYDDVQAWLLRFPDLISWNMYLYFFSVKMILDDRGARLRRLNIQIRDRFDGALWQKLEGCTNLTELSITTPFQTMDTGDARSVIEKMPHLQSLRLTFLYSVNDSFLQSLGAHCKKLRFIVLTPSPDSVLTYTKEGLNALKSIHSLKFLFIAYAPPFFDEWCRANRIESDPITQHLYELEE